MTSPPTSQSIQRTTNYRRVAKAGLAGLLLALLAACAGMAPAKPEDMVKARATERWQALIAGDFKKAYELTPPSYRAVTSLDRYSSQFGNAATWTGVEVTQVTCEPETCMAKVQVSAQVPLGRAGTTPISTYIDETWVLEDTKWWMYQKL